MTATLRFRHLPPYFVTGLAEANAEAERIPEQAKIDDPEELLGNMVVTDVVTAQTGDEAVLACNGPQNDPGGTIFNCLGDDAEQDDEEAAGLASPFLGTLPER